MKIKNVTIAGAGVLGSQIAWQTAFHGFNVTVYDAFEKGLEDGKHFHKQFAELFITERGATDNEIQQTFARLNYTTNLAVFLKTNYIEKGNLGVKSGQGFYSYPNPKYHDKNFLN